MKFTLYKIFVLLGLSVLLAGAVFCGYRLVKLSSQREEIKEDYSLSNSITFGLFSVDQWREKIGVIIDSQIDGYHITGEQKRDLQKTVEGELHRLVGQTVREINKPQKSIGGKLKKLAFNILVDSAEIQAQVKPFAKTIVTKVGSRESEERLKEIAGSKIDQLVDQIYDSTKVANYRVTKYVFNKYKVTTTATFDQQVKTKIADIKKDTLQFVYILFGCVIMALLLWWFTRKVADLKTIPFVFSLLFALTLLVTGSLVPVIEVDARISSLSLALFDEKLQFENQVLFYQSKSVVGIVSTLISQQKPDTVIVGALIMLFVLVLPLLRLIAKGIYVLSTKKIARHPVIKYMTFELGKWDMADVMVVGMLMTYIGLNGILKSQLSGLTIHTDSLIVITDNGTSIQAGYFIFTCYVIFSKLLSQILKRVSPHDKF